MHPIHHAATRPEHSAIIMAGSGETLSYAELDRFANRFARWLRANDLKAGDALGILLENRIEYLPLAWGSQRAGSSLRLATNIGYARPTPLRSEPITLRGASISSTTARPSPRSFIPEARTAARTSASVTRA